MNLRICCEANVELEDYHKVDSVNYNVKNYNLTNESLNGFVSVNGMYLNQNNEVCNYCKDVPFTVMFNNKNYNIESINLDNFDYYEIVNNGIVCSFDLLIDYNMNISESSVPNVIYKTEKEDFKLSNNDVKLNDKKLEKQDFDNNNIIKDNLNDDIKELCDDKDLDDDKNLNNYKSNDVDNEDEFESIEVEDLNNNKNDDANDDDIEEEIKEKYDKLLDDIFNSREEEQNLNVVPNNNPNNKINKTQEINVNVNKVNNNKFSFLKFLDNKSTIRVYYPEKESEIETICKNENLSISDIYSDAYNKDFSEKKRIIIK